VHWIGTDAPQDHHAAIRWYERAAGSGSEIAGGAGSANDRKGVRALLAELAGAGNPTAALLLAQDLAGGVHGPRDPDGAMHAGFAQRWKAVTLSV